MKEYKGALTEIKKGRLRKLMCTTILWMNMQESEKAYADHKIRYENRFRENGGLSNRVSKRHRHFQCFMSNIKIWMKMHGLSVRVHLTT